ncbi:unnamed protein product, partial [Ectocarpus sp. 6 AP-2014]
LTGERKKQVIPHWNNSRKERETVCAPPIMHTCEVWGWGWVARFSSTTAESVLSPCVADLEEFCKRQPASDSPGLPRSGTHTHDTLGTTVSQVNAFRQAIPELANL